MAELVFREGTQATWPDLVALFESPGAPGYCWCMAWRPMGAKERQGPSDARRAAMKSLIDAGVPVGILGYLQGAPIGWCSIAPRRTYRPLGGPDDPEEVWSLTCFFVKREWRGHNLSRALLQAAIDYAARSGARLIEAYPVDPDSPSYRFMGFVDLFRRNGFEEVGRAGSRRHVMRRAISADAEPVST